MASGSLLWFIAILVVPASFYPGLSQLPPPSALYCLSVIASASLISKRGDLVGTAHFFFLTQVVSVGSWPVVYLAFGQMLMFDYYWPGRRWGHIV